MSDEMEQSIQNANSMADVRSAATKTPGLKESFSVKPTISLLSEVLGRLSLKDQPFQMMDSPSEADLNWILFLTVFIGLNQQYGEHTRKNAI